MKATPKLLDLLSRQYQESDQDLQLRIARWARFLAAWRGHYTWDKEALPTGATPEATFDGFWRDLGASATAMKTVQESGGGGKLYWKETFYHIQTIMTRLNEAFLAPKKPFTLRQPRVVRGAPPDPLKQKIRGVSLRGAEEYLLWAFRHADLQGEYRDGLLNMCIFGTGIMGHREADDDQYPRAQVDSIRPWQWRSDPMSRKIRTARYGILDRWYSKSEAVGLFPDCEQAIDQAAQDMPDTTMDADRPKLERRTVHVLEYHGRYDLRAIENLELGGDAQDAGKPVMSRILALCTADGPSEELLKVSVRPYGHGEIPFQELVCLRSPSEWGCAGIGFADLLEDGQDATNTYVNLMLRQFGLSVLGGGIVDSSKSGDLARVLRRPFRPSEWRFAKLNGASIKDIMHRLDVDPPTTAHQANLEYIRSAHPLYTGVSPMSAGVTTRTYSNTLGEVSNLQAESNSRFRFTAESIDPEMHRSFRLYVNMSAEAIKGVYQAGEPPLFWQSEDGKFYLISPDTFDTDLEVELRSGSTWVDDQAEAMDLMGLIEVAQKAGAQPLVVQALRRVAEVKHLDPDLVANEAPPTAPAPPQELPPGAAIPLPGPVPPGPPVGPGMTLGGPPTLALAQPQGA